MHDEGMEPGAPQPQYDGAAAPPGPSTCPGEVLHVGGRGSDETAGCPRCMTQDLSARRPMFGPIRDEAAQEVRVEP